MEQILVAMKKRDRIQEIVPILEKMAEQKILLARESLEKMGIEVALALKGCLRRAVRDTMLNGDFQLILMSAINGNTTIEVARLLLVLLRRLRRPSFASILLHHPRRGADSTASAFPG
jgi:hypothetical protein